MIRIGVLLTALTFIGVLAGYPGGSTENNLSAGETTSNSFGYGYSGSFPGGAPPNFPQINFQGFLNSYLDSINKYHQEFIKKGGGQLSYSYASSSPNANAQASSSIVYSSNNRLQSATAQAAQSVPPQAGGASGASSSSGGAPVAFSGGFNFPAGVGAGAGAGAPPNLFGRFGAEGQEGGAAIASAAISPNGVQQTAAVYPENPNVPNVNTQFAGTGQPGGFRSVFTSSASHTTNLNGQQKTVQQASTTVNDNGKVTTYTVKNP